MTQFLKKLQKGTSLTLIFAILFAQTVHIPLLERASASRAAYPNLISILIPESLNSGDVADGVLRYAKDIQGAMPGSRAIILELPNDATPEKIAALNEKLYYEGDGKDSARLVGTVLIGNIPLPVVHKKEKTFLSVFPYVDFKNKAFTYDTSKGYYDYSNDTSASDSPEIWHGIIAPNTGNVSTDEQKLVSFFAKSHDFYTKSGKYSAEETRPEPYVFYFDSYHDELSIKSEDWQAYKLGLKNVEDIIYNRYNKHFAKKLYDAYQDILTGSQKDITDESIKNLTSSSGSSIDLSTAPDIQTQSVVNQIAKKFTDVLNSKYLGEILRYVYNAGRYGDATNVHVDISAALVAKQDDYAVKSLKDVTTSLENAIDLLAKNGLSRGVAITTGYNNSVATSSSTISNGVASTKTKTTSTGYTNYFMGRKADTITEAKDCTIVRGSTLRVEANRGYNPNVAQSDTELLNGDLGSRCFPGGSAATTSYWGKNSPLSADFSVYPFLIRGNSYTGFSKSIFDIAGGKELDDTSALGQLSASKCLATDLLREPYEGEMDATGKRVNYFPEETEGKRYSCITKHQTTEIKTFTDYYTEGFPNIPCVINQLTLNGTVVYTSPDNCLTGTSGGSTGNSGNKTTNTYAYNKIPSVIEHKSPTLEEFAAQAKAMTTPSLPADQDRFVSFITPKGAEASIYYPNFFRLTLDENSLTKDKAKVKIKELLDKKSSDINGLITAENPKELSGKNLEIYNLLKSGTYPNPDVDLYAMLAKNPDTLDALANAVVWNNISSPTSKYAYLLENFLDTDGNSSVPLPGHRSDYEIAYIGGKGDSQNLYLKVDAEAKLPLPDEIASLSAEMGSFTQSLSAMNAANSGNVSNGQFKCSPPDGVPLWEWLPAIFCWMSTILPPTISPGSCSSSSLTDILSKQKESDLKKDSNGNGVPDAYEDADGNGIQDGMQLVKDGKIELKSASKRVSYASSVTLTATFFDKSGNRILVDSGNEVSFEVTKIVDRSGKIPKTVYVRGESGDLGDDTVIRKYVNVGSEKNAETPAKVRVKDGVAEYSFSVNSVSADVSFDATVAPRDKNRKAAFVKTSDPYTLEVRDESLSVSFTDANGQNIPGSVHAGDLASLGITITKKRSDADVAVSYPVTLRVYDDTTDDTLGDPIVISSSPYTLKSPILNRAGSLRFEFAEKNGLVEKKSFTILSAKATKIEAIPASNMFVRGEKNKVIVKITDAFGNLVQGDIVNLTAKLSGGGYFDENKSDTVTKSVVDGYTSFDVSSNNGGENITLSVSIDNNSLRQDISLKTIDYAKIIVAVAGAGNITAGKDPHDVSVKLVDGNGNILSGFSGFASLSFPEASGYFDTNLIQIENGASKTPAKLYPKTVAGNKLSILVSIPGVKDISGNIVDVHNDVPMYATLAAQYSKMEAFSGNAEKITATLHDRYGNIASYNTNSITGNLSVEAGSEKYIRLSGTGGLTFSGGVAESAITTTSLPGTSYLVLSLSPSLAGNTASYTDESGKTVTLSGKDKNLLKIETFYLWNKSKIDKTDYNALYSVLLGASYGNVSESGYLAGELLFRENSRALAVTSLLANGLDRTRIASITPAGKIELSEDAFTEVTLGEEYGRTTLAITDSYENAPIAKAYTSLGNGTDFIACGNDGNDGINNCSVPVNSNAYAILKPSNDLTVLTGNGLSLVANGIGKIMEVTQDGRIRASGSVKFELDTENTKNLLALKIFYGGKEAGYLAIKMRSEDIVLAWNSENISEILAARPYSLVVQSISPNYTTDRNYLGNSSFGKKGVSFYLSSDDAGTAADRDLVGWAEKMGYESYYEEKGIGWEWANKTLLDFAGGSSVGEANKMYASFNTVNLGDPVVKLSRKSDSTYDRTIGSRIMQTSDDNIESYASFDYNHDGLSDIIVFFSSGKMQLFENEGGTFKDMGNLAYIADAGKLRKSTGNFEGDGYDDIVFIDKNGKFNFLQNHEGKFSRVNVPIVNPDNSPAVIGGKITQLAVYDMDQDGLDDVIIADDSGVISALYSEKRGDSFAFVKKVVDSSLGIKLSNAASTSGSAIRYDGMGEIAEHTQLDYISESASMDPNASGIPEATAKAMADSRIYYTSTVTTEEDMDITASSLSNALAAGTLGNDPTNPNSANTGAASSIASSYANLENTAGSDSLPTTQKVLKQTKMTFIRSEFSEAKWVTVEKSYEDTNGAPLQGGDIIRNTLIVKNTSGKALSGVRVLTAIDSNISTLSDTSYILKKENTTSTGTITELEGESYGESFAPLSLQAGESVTITYNTKANSLSFGRFVVGALNKDDAFGDVAMAASNSCSDSMTVWKGTGYTERTFTKTSQSFTGAELPKEITTLQTDSDGDGRPDALQAIMSATGAASAQAQNFAKTTLGSYNTDTNGNGVPDRSDNAGTLDNGSSLDTNNGQVDVGSFGANADAINSQIDTVVAGLGCGFGGGSCIASPLNWAPLAPGSVPTVMGYPMGNLTALTGVPIFAFPTSCTIVPVWPPCPVGAGGYLSPMNISQFRLFVTPTITGAVGAAICFGSNYGVWEKSNPKWVSPVVPGGNCVVAAKPLALCKDDGSDGDVNSLGYQNGSYTSGGAFINANSCSANVDTNSYTTEQQQILTEYARSGKNATKAGEIAGSKSIKSLGAGPLIGIGNPTSSSENFNVALDSNSLKNFSLGSIINIKNTRISAFPDFLMDWVNRQLEEIVNKLTSLPTLSIILPDFSKVFESGWAGFSDKLGQSYSNGENAAKDKEYSVGTSNTAGFQQAKDSTNAFLSKNKSSINSAAKGISGIKAAYKFLSKLPAIAFENSTVNINIPIIAEEDIQKSIAALGQWKKEITTKKEEWSKLSTADGASKQASLDASRLTSTIDENLKTLESYSQFPEKIQKYLSWKQRYASQLLCNIESIEKMMGGWISDNGKRFKTWVEFYILIKAILKSWQPLVDLFTDYKAQCGSCKNERYDLKHFVFKLISAVIPKIPVVQFPKWPDIILDLHNVRLGLRIAMPEFVPTFTPITIPHIPELHLPKVPKVGLSLPGLPSLPKLPGLPDLPDLPSLPEIKLPDLPPPPKIPKLFSSISAVLSILKIVAKVLCIMRINPFVPEWRAGDQIAQMTERSGTLPIDFLNMEYPNIPISFLKAIKVTSYVNLEFQADFILEMAKSTVEPINSFTSNVTNIGSGLQPQNIDIQGPDNINVDIPGKEWQEISSPLGRESSRLSPETKTAMVGWFTLSLAKWFSNLLSEIQKQSNDEMTFADFKKTILDETTELRKEKNEKILAIANSLERAASYDGKNEDALTTALLADNTDKFSIAKNAISAEIRETQALSAKFKEFFASGNITGLDRQTNTTIKIAALTPESDHITQANTLLASYNASAVSAFEDLQNPKEDTELQDIGNSLKSRVLALTESASTETFSEKAEREKVEMAGNVTTGDVTNSENLASQSKSSYIYRGIYYFENGKQKRLFDYTDELDGTENTVLVNRSSGGAKNSIVYRMDNGLYLKHPVADTPTGTNTDTPDTLALDDIMGDRSTPSAPNYFNETVVSPDEIQFSFASANKDQDRKFRLEFYDYIERFDRLKDGANIETLSPKTPLQTIDLFADDDRLVTDATKPGALISKTEAVYERGVGDASGTIAQYKTFSAGETLKVSADRRLYSYNGAARIKYRKDDATEWVMANLKEYENITFSEAMEIQVLDGSVVFAEDRYDTGNVDMGILAGLPIMEKTSLTLLGDTGFFVVRYDDDSSVRIDRKGTYSLLRIGNPSDSYAVSVKKPNDFYYAKLSSFGNGEDTTEASLTLLSPQVAGDESGPINIGLADVYRIPIYTKEIFAAKTYFSDISGIARMTADTNPSTDSDGNGVTDDDQDSNSNGFIHKNPNDPTELTIGPFDAPGTHAITLSVVDKNGNVTKQNLSIIVYTPTPEILSNSGTHISGKLESEIGWEPIDIMRVRAGNIKRLSGSGVVSSANDGTFAGDYGNGENLNLTDASGSVLATIDEHSGIIKNLKSGFTVSIEWATATTPLSLVIKNGNGKTVFTEQLSLSKHAALAEITDKKAMVSSGLYYLSADSSMSFVKNTANSKTLPSGAFITNNSSKKAIAGIGSDGNIYLLDTTYSLGYTEDTGHLAIIIKNASGQEIGRAIYAISAEFILR